MKPHALSQLFDTLRTRLSLPLLGKELTEMAARRRTYILRVVYAFLLFLVFWFFMPSRAFLMNTDTGNLPSHLLGFGRDLFERLMVIQFFGVLLFQPALMCGRITQEKERDSLVLLFLTKLRPSGIVLQKYLGGLVPMLSFLLLGLPLAGVAYAFGGITSSLLVEGAGGVFLMTLQFGALSLMCSAWCRTTVSALILSYVLGLIFYAGPPVLANLIGELERAMNPSMGYSLTSEKYRFLLIPPAALEFGVRNSAHRYWLVLPSAFSVIVFLVLARLFLVRRAFLPPFDLLPRLFAWIDRFMKSANRLVGGVVLYRDSASVTEYDPIFWRETHRRVLGKPHYLFRLLCALEVPTVLICLVVVLGEFSSWSGSSFSMTAFLLGALAMFTLSATAANSIVSERVGQTLEVLLTTPIKAVEIIRQKERALRRLEWILAVPLITVFAARAFMIGGEFDQSYRDWFSYLTFATLVVLLYLPMITWLSLWIGLRVRTRFQAILAALGAITAWMALTPLLAVVLDSDKHSPWWLIISPVGLPTLNEFDKLPTIGNFMSSWPAIIINMVLYTVIAFSIRGLLFRDAERCLRR